MFKTKGFDRFHSNRFLKQELEKIPSAPKLLGLGMTWLLEKEKGASVDLTDNSYFYLQRVESI